jgi:hypothetical protein
MHLHKRNHYFCWTALVFFCLQNSISHNFLVVATSPTKPPSSSQLNLNMESKHKILSQCACGKVQIQVQLPTNSDIAVDCHCGKCRKFHVAAFASYLVVPEDQVSWGDNNDNGEDPWQRYTEDCDEVGTVERIFCKHCYTKMASKPISKEDKEKPKTMLVNMGGLIDKTIPKNYKEAWKKGRTQWQESSRPAWAQAKPPRVYKTGMPPLTTAPSGSCACGNCQYQIRHVPYEFQHCYCHLCRQLSGAAFQSWIPVDNQHLVWKQEPPLKRTTNHGQRHVCTNCGGVLTIVYDDQPDTTWPAAGGLDDATLPQEMEQYLDRVCHICCIWKQDWYTLPKDGLERIQYAC